MTGRSSASDAPRGRGFARRWFAGPGDDDDPVPIGDPDDDDWDDDEDDEDDEDDDDEEPLQASDRPRLASAPRPPSGPGDVDGDELPMGDPPDDDPSDDPNDEDEGEGDDEPLHGGAVRPPPRRSLLDRAGARPRPVRAG